MGGKPDTSAADTANAQAAQQAAQARQEQEAQKAQLDAGYKQIQGIFEGTPVMANTTTSNAYNWGGFDPSKAVSGAAVSGLPSGYSYLQAPAGAASPGAQIAENVFGQGPGGDAQRAKLATTLANPPASTSVFGTRGSVNGLTPAQIAGGMKPLSTTAGTPGAAGAWEIIGPDGQVHKQGDAFNYSTTGQTDTGARTGGFNDAFYNSIADNVRQAGENDITDQFNKAQENLTYATARQGLGASSAGNQGLADLYTSKGKAETDLGNQAADAAQTVRSQVDSQKAAALAQLYATNDPTVAANTALTSAQTVRAAKPNYQSLGDIFNGALQAFGTLKNSGALASAYSSGSSSPAARSALG